MLHISIVNLIFFGFLILGAVLILTSKMEGQYFPMPDGNFFLGFIIIILDIILRLGIFIGKLIN